MVNADTTICNKNYNVQGYKKADHVKGIGRNGMAYLTGSSAEFIEG